MYLIVSYTNTEHFMMPVNLYHHFETNHSEFKEKKLNGDFMSSLKAKNYYNFFKLEMKRPLKPPIDFNF